MIEFMDGPAEGVTLQLRRMPILLRVTRKPSRCKAEWDALDQLEDQPDPAEEIFVYRRRDDLPQSKYHLLRSPRKLSGWYWSGTYSLFLPQPADDQVRTTAAWQEWANAHFQQEQTG